MAVDIIARAMAATAAQESSGDEGCTCGEDHLSDNDVVTDPETEEALDEVFGDGITDTQETDTTTVNSVAVNESKVATTSEVESVLNEVFDS